MAVGFVIVMGCLVIDFKQLGKLHLLIYTACVGLLVATWLVGHTGGGSQRWLVLGPVRIQTSELMKISLIISLASVYADTINPEGLGFRHLIKPAILCIIPVGLIVIPPDLGTGLLLLLIAGCLTLFVKVEKKVVFTLKGDSIILLNNTPVELEKIESMLNNELMVTADHPVTLRVPESLPYSEVIAFINRLKKMGYQKVKLETLNE